MRIIFCVLLVFFLTSNAFAEIGSIPCEGGSCDGWEGEYERRGDYAKVIFLNKTGKTAFKIKLLINCYDYFDTFITRIETKHEGPINVQIPYVIKVPKDTSKMTYSIYWVDTYQPD